MSDLRKCSLRGCKKEINIKKDSYFKTHNMIKKAYICEECSKQAFSLEEWSPLTVAENVQAFIKGQNIDEFYPAYQLLKKEYIADQDLKKGIEATMDKINKTIRGYV